jgi:hypothetical protein
VREANLASIVEATTGQKRYQTANGIISLRK